MAQHQRGYDVTDDPAKKLAEATERYAQMMAANIAASRAVRAGLDDAAYLSPVETALRQASDKQAS